MKKILFLLLLGGQSIAFSQGLKTKPYVCTHVEKTDGQIKITADYDFRNKTIEKKDFAVIIPYLKDSVNNKKLSAIVLAGGKKYRALRKPKAKKKYPALPWESLTVYKDNDGEFGMQRHTDTIKYERWMREAQYGLTYSLFNKKGCLRESVNIPLREQLLGAIPLPAFQCAFIDIPNDSIKQEQTDLTICLKTDKNNPGTRNFLKNTDAMVKELLQNDKNGDILMTVSKCLAISPLTISKQTKDYSYITRELKDAYPYYTVRENTTSFNWKPVYDYVKEHPEFENRDIFEQILDSGESDTYKRAKLMRINHGATWKDIASKGEARYDGIIINVSLMKKISAKENLERTFFENPGKLSREQIYRLASFYGTNDRTLWEIYKKAVKLYPEDKILRANALASRILLKDVSREDCATSEQSVSCEEMNNAAIIYSMLGEYDKAWKNFLLSSQMGCRVAYSNLYLMNKYLRDL